MKVAIISCFLLIIVGIVFAIDWPVQNIEIVSTFGSNLGGKFSTGLSISGRNSNAYTIDRGEIIFYSDKENSPEKLPSGLGNFVAVRHDDGLKSIYTHLQSGSVETYAAEKYLVESGAVLGKVGDTGWTYGRHLGLLILDTEFNQFVNPLLILPSVLDTIKPVIEDVRLQFGDTEIRVEEGATVEGGQYNLVADIYDVNQFTRGFNPMAPFSITVFINGSEINRYTFEALQESDENIILQKTEGKDFNAVYFSPRSINLGKYDVIPGNMSIEIIVTDYSGNESSFLQNITVSG